VNDWVRAVATRDPLALGQLVDLAGAVVEVGATRQRATDFFLEEIGHYVYAGDTAMHVAAAAYWAEMTAALIGGGGDVHAVNRRGATPLHHADAKPEQAEILRLLRSQAQ